MDFPECKDLLKKFDECRVRRSKQVWDNILAFSLPPDEGNCESTFSDYKDCYSEYMEKYILELKRKKGEGSS